MVEQPRRWDIKFIRKFMLAFGILSLQFDYLTFGCLLLYPSYRESIQNRLVHRISGFGLFDCACYSKSKTVFKSNPGKYLLLATLLTVAVTLILPITPLAGLLEFRPLPLSFILMLGAILLTYIVAAEVLKKVFYARVKL